MRIYATLCRLGNFRIGISQKLGGAGIVGLLFGGMIALCFYMIYWTFLATIWMMYGAFYVMYKISYGVFRVFRRLVLHVVDLISAHKAVNRN